MRILSQLPSLLEDTNVSFLTVKWLRVRNTHTKGRLSFPENSHEQEDTLACSHVSLVSGTPLFTKSLLYLLYANSYLSTAQDWPGSGLHGLQEGTLQYFLCWGLRD